jgi:phosphotransferase system HPr (HPr) family protein
MDAATVTIRNKRGIHCRPAAMIAREAKLLDTHQILIHCPQHEPVDARDLLGLISLGLPAGSQIQVSVSGPDEEFVCQRFAGLFQGNFEFD